MSRFYSTIQDINAMKNFIMALPRIVPCHTTHITNHVDRNRDNLDANKEVLYDFLRDFYFDIKQKFGNELYEDTYYHGI